MVGCNFCGEGKECREKGARMRELQKGAREWEGLERWGGGGIKELGKGEGRGEKMCVYLIIGCATGGISFHWDYLPQFSFDLFI